MLYLSGSDFESICTAHWHRDRHQSEGGVNDQGSISLKSRTDSVCKSERNKKRKNRSLFCFWSFFHWFFVRRSLCGDPFCWNRKCGGSPFDGEFVWFHRNFAEKKKPFSGKMRRNGLRLQRGWRHCGDGKGTGTERERLWMAMSMKRDWAWSRAHWMKRDWRTPQSLNGSWISVIYVNSARTEDLSALFPFVLWGDRFTFRKCCDLDEKLWTFWMGFNL